MSGSDFSDAALVLLGHGSTKNSDSAAPVYQHAAELRRRQIFAGVYEAFWKQEPLAAAVLGSLAAGRVFIVPLFMSEGYFSNRVIPRALGFPEGSTIVRKESTHWFYCEPIGTHERMTAVLLARAWEIVDRFPFPLAPPPGETSLIIAGHGTTQDENSRKAIEQHVERIRRRNEFADVHAVFLEEQPRIAECYSLATARHLVIVPFFISDGLHTREDIPILLGEPERMVKERIELGLPTWRNPTQRQGKLVWYASAVGTDPQVGDVILDRVTEAAARKG